MGIMNKMVIKKMTYDSPEFKDSRAEFVNGTPQYRWEQFWELLLAANFFTKHYADFSKPLRRDVVNVIRE
jgi:hypothetical protein